MSKCLLLDFDGVMLKNKGLSTYQQRRSAKFVQKHTYMNLSTCEELNRLYYPTYGHTVTMLNKLFNSNTTLEEYNEFVFDRKQLKRLNNLLDKETINHMISFEKFIDKSNTNQDVSWSIFTNAHINWILHFCERIGLQGFAEDKVIWPVELTYLKPNEDAYISVEKQFDSTDTFIFIDDSLVNIQAAQQRGWECIWMKDGTDVSDVYNKFLDLCESNSYKR